MRSLLKRLAAQQRRQPSSAEVARPAPSDVAEALQDVRNVRDRLREILPAVVVASERYEDRDGVLTEPVAVLAKLIGVLEAAAELLAE